MQSRNATRGGSRTLNKTTAQAVEAQNSELPEGVYEIIEAALSKKGENIKVFDVKNISSLSDTFVICSAFSERQVQAIVDAITHQVRKSGHSVLGTEGYREGRWVLIDLGETMVHVFLDALRDYYDLESLWARGKRLSLPAKLFEPSASPVQDI